jgi:hypothetical protein
MSHKFISLLLLFGIIAFSSAFEYPPAPAPAPALVPPTVERPGISIVLVLFAIFGGLAVVAAVLFVFINDCLRVVALFYFFGHILQLSLFAYI